MNRASEKGLIETGARSAAGRSLGRPDLERLSTPQLIARLAQDAQTLIKAEIELGKSELRAGLASGLATLRQMVAGVVLGLLAAGVLVAGGVLALATVLPAWAAAVIVSAALAAASLVAFTRAQSRPPHPRPPAGEI